MFGEPPQKWQRVELSLEFRDAVAAEVMGKNLKKTLLNGIAHFCPKRGCKSHYIHVLLDRL